MDLNLLFCCIDSSTCNHEDIVVNYINLGGDINICNRRGYTLLIKACRHNFKIDTIKLIISKKIDINQQNNFGNTALMYAAKYCEFDVVKLLLDYGADMDIKNNRSVNALYYASVNKKNNFKLMLEYKYTHKPCCSYHVNTFNTWTDKFDESYYIEILKTRCSTINDYGYFSSICAGLI